MHNVKCFLSITIKLNFTLPFVLFQLLCIMEKIHVIKTPFWHRRTNLSENHKSKKFRAANTSTTYDAQNVDHLCDNSLSEANENVSDCTFGSETTFDKSIETASLMSSVSEENTLDIPSPSNCEIPLTSSSMYENVPEHIHQEVADSLECTEQQPISLFQTSFSSYNSNHSQCTPSITTVIKKNNKSTMCRTADVCFIKSKEV